MAKIKVDFTGVESYVRCEEGEHIVALKEAEEKSSSQGNDMIAVKLEVVKGSSAGAVLYDNFVLTEKALWKLKGYLEVIGVKADGKVALDLDKLVGKRCIVSVEHEEYNGNMRARIKDYKKIEAPKEEPDEEEEWEEEEEETPPPKKSGKKEKPGKKQPKPQDDDDDDDWEDA